MDRKGDKTILKDVALAEFFKERIQEAMGHQEVAASALAEFYLVNLLEEFRKTEKLFEQQGSRLCEKPLAILLAEALKGDPQTKIRCLKKLGDLSLYTVGFFGERIKRTLVDRNYYIRMGGGAYESLSVLMNRQKTFAQLYAELAHLFPNLVEVLAEVAMEAYWKSNRDLLKLYEKWLATGNETLEKLLQGEGIQTQDRTLLNKIQ